MSSTVSSDAPQGGLDSLSSTLLAALLLTLAIQVGRGEATPTSVTLVVGALWLLVRAVRTARTGTVPEAGRMAGLARLGIALQAALMATMLLEPAWKGDAPALVFVWLAASIIVLVVLALLVSGVRASRWGPGVDAALVAVAASVGLSWLVVSTTGIDVWMFQDEGTRRLLAGTNPYAFGYPDVYPPELSRRFYAPGISEDGELQAGFPYPPVSLVLATLGQLLGDVRSIHLGAVLLSGWLLLRMQPAAPLARIAGALFLTNPITWLVLQHAWTEPLVVAGLALGVFAMVRSWWSTPLWLSLMVGTKQYAVLLLPALLVVPPRWRDGIARLRTGLVVLLLAAVPVIPFLLWDPAPFAFSVGLWQFEQPFRPDALSLSAAAVRWWGLPLGNWITAATVVAAAMALGFVLWRAPRTNQAAVAGCALVAMAFVVVSKQAFANYYLLVIGAAYLSIAVAGVTPRKASAPG